MPHPSSAHLNLWKQRLGRVPESVWSQIDLETLVLADNTLSEVSAQIGCLKRLRTLDLGHNELTRVPDSLAELEELSDFLYLNDNRLIRLPPSLARLKRLRYPGDWASLRRLPGGKVRFCSGQLPRSGLVRRSLKSPNTRMCRLTEKVSFPGR